MTELMEVAKAQTAVPDTEGKLPSTRIVSLPYQHSSGKTDKSSLQSADARYVTLNDLILTMPLLWRFLSRPNIPALNPC